MNDKELVEALANWSDSEFAAAASGEYCEDLKSRIEGELAKQADTIEALQARVDVLEAQQLSVLAGFYLEQPVTVAKICDTVLDRSGALLGRVRKHAAEIKSRQALAGDDHG